MDNSSQPRKIIDACPDSIIQIDRSGTILVANKACAERFGRTVDSILEKCIFDFMPPNVAEQRRAGWALLEDAKEAITYLDQREGQWFESRVVPTFDDDGNLDSAYIFAQDVSDQKRAEKELQDNETRLGAMFDAQTAELRNSEARFRSTFERSAVGLAVATQNGELRLINQALCDFLGYSKDEMVGMPLRSFSHPDDLAETIDALERLFRQEFVTHDFEKRYIRKDGETVWGRVRLSTINDQDGNPLEALAVIQDITQRKMAEIALRESETRLRHAQSLAKLGTFDRNFSDGTVTWSPEARRIYGVSDSEEISFERFIGFIHADDRDRVSETLKSMNSDNPTFEIELRVQRDDGSVRHTHTFGEMVYDEDGNATRLIGTNQDITERKLAEQNLRQSEARFRSVFENSAVGMTYTDLNGAIMVANQAYCDLLGYSSDELIGRKVSDLTHPDDRVNPENLSREMAAGSFEIRDSEKRLLPKDGRALWARVNFSTVNDDGGRPIGTIGVIQGITRQKSDEIALRESETQLRHAQSLAKLGTFDRNMSSDTVTWSKEARRLYGVSDSEVITTERFFSLIHPDDRERVSETFKSMNPDNATFEIELRVQRDDGSVRRTHTFGEMVYDEDGNATRLIGTNQDITARKLAEEKPRDSEARFRNLFENSAVGMALTDLDAKILLVNQAYCNFLGYSADELAGKPIYQLTHPDDREERGEVERLGEEGNFEVRDSEKRLLHKDGSTRWARVNLSYVRGEDGNAAGVLGVIQDITRQKHDEMALQASETRLRHAQSIAQLGYFERDLQTDVITWSDEVAEIFGQSKSESIRMNEFIELVHPDDRDRVATTVYTAIEGPRSRRTGRQSNRDHAGYNRTQTDRGATCGAPTRRSLGATDGRLCA